jgi:hypothetical protein
MFFDDFLSSMYKESFAPTLLNELLLPVSSLCFDSNIRISGVSRFDGLLTAVLWGETGSF